MHVTPTISQKFSSNVSPTYLMPITAAIKNIMYAPKTFALFHNIETHHCFIAYTNCNALTSRNIVPP